MQYVLHGTKQLTTSIKFPHLKTMLNSTNFFCSRTQVVVTIIILWFELVCMHYVRKESILPCYIAQADFESLLLIFSSSDQFFS